MEHIISPSPSTARRACAASVVALLAWVAWPADATAETVPDPALVGQVSPTFATTCTSTTIDRADAAIVCTPPAASGVTDITYARFSNAELAGTYYDDAKGRGLEPDGDCADLSDSEGQYHTTSGKQGRLACSTAHHESTITWTDDTVVATATGKNDERLYKWWDKLVGRTLTDAQRALLTELPAGIPRSGCRDNGESSLKCFAPYKYAGEVYVLYFTKYADEGALNAAYDAILADNGLERDLPAPDSYATGCNYETFWGPGRDRAVTDERGRIACFEELVANDLVWTRDDVRVLTRAKGYTPKLLMRFFRVYSGGPTEPSTKQEPTSTTGGSDA